MAATLGSAGGAMAGPSDSFFRDVVATVGGELAAKLPDVEKRRTAAKALGQDLSLADVAVKMGLLTDAKRAELAQLEGGDAPAASPAPAPAPAPPASPPSPTETKRTAASKLPSAGKVAAAGVKTPSAGKVAAAGVKTPSAGKVPVAAAPRTPSAGKVPAAAAPKAAPPGPAATGGLGECVQCGTPLAAGADPRGTGLCASCRGEARAEDEGSDGPSRSGTRGTRRRPRGGITASGAVRSARPPASASTGPLLIMAALVLAASIVAVALIVKQAPPPEPVASPTPSPAAASPQPVTVVVPSPAASAPPPPDAATHKAKLANMALVAIKLARAGDRTAAKKQLARIRLEATEPEDQEIVRSAEKEVDRALQEASQRSPTPAPVVASGASPSPVAVDPQPAPSPEANPAEVASRIVYREFRAKLDPLLARLELEAAKALLAQPPALEGSAAQDLADDQQVPPALQKFLEIASRGATKAVGSSQDLKLASGGHVRGTVTEVLGQDLTLRGSGGEIMVKVSELAPEDLFAFANQGLTKDSQQDYSLGRGLVSYYTGDAENSKRMLAATSLPLGKRFLDRLGIEGTPKVGPRPSPGTPQPGASKPPRPEDSPAPPDDTGMPAGISAADLATLQALVGATVSDEGGGRVGIRYGCSGDGEGRDFDSRGCDVFEVKQTEKPGTYMQPFTDLECGISSNDDVAILHKIAFRGDVEIQFRFWVNYMHDSNSGLTFVVGYDKKRWVGAAYGQQLWRSDGKTRAKAISPTPPELAKFSQARDCTVRLVRKGDSLKVTFNGLECGTATGASGYDGKWGILAHNVKIGIRSIEVHGTPIVPAK